MKDKFQNTIKDFRTSILLTRNKQAFNKKWKENRVEGFCYGGWCINQKLGSYEYFIKGYYIQIRSLMEKGFNFVNIKEKIKTKLDTLTKEMNTILKRDNQFTYEENEEICLDFSLCITCLCKMKAIPSSNEFGIVSWGNKPFKVITLY